jgi:hypothetical protein
MAGTSRQKTTIKEDSHVGALAPLRNGDVSVF